MNTRIRENLKYQLKHNKMGLIAVIIIVILVLAAIFAFLVPHDPNRIFIMDKLQPPSKEHIFGTDALGRDYFARALYGGRVSLTVGFLSMIISTTIGTLVGTISGYIGGKTDSIIMRAIDILMSVPTFFLILILNAYLKPGLQNIIIIIGLFSWMGTARIVRGETLSLKEREYVLYANAIGEKRGTVILKHIIPNIFPTVIVVSTLNIAKAILTESALSFLGLGISQPNSSWGSMLKGAQSKMDEAPYLAIFPGLLILLTVLSFNILGDTIRVAIDPKANNR